MLDFGLAGLTSRVFSSCLAHQVPFCGNESLKAIFEQFHRNQSHQNLYLLYFSVTLIKIFQYVHAGENHQFWKILQCHRKVQQTSCFQWRPQKLKKSSPSIWHLLHNVKSTVNIFVNLCGLLRKHEIYIIEFWYNIHNIRNVTYLKIIIRIKIKIVSIYAIEQSSNFWNPTLYNLIAVNSSMYIQFKCAYSSTLFTVEPKSM